MNINKLRELLNSSKMSKVQLAEKCNISRTTLDNALQGSDAKISTIESLSKALNVPIGYFFDEDVDCSNNQAISLEIDQLRKENLRLEGENRVLRELAGLKESGKAVG